MNRNLLLFTAAALLGTVGYAAPAHASPLQSTASPLQTIIHLPGTNQCLTALQKSAHHPGATGTPDDLQREPGRYLDHHCGTCPVTGY